MSGLENQARRIGARAVERARDRVAAALREELGEAVGAEADGVVVTGRGAVARMLGDAALRWIAGMIR